jgi:type III secretion system HrpE/YscL family protein
VRKVIKPSGPAGPSSAAASRTSGGAKLSGKRIIEREVVGATKEAARILAEAEEQAAQILEDAKEQAAETHQRGYEEGRQQAYAEFTGALMQRLQRLDHIEAQLEPHYVRLVCSIVERVLGHEFDRVPESIVAIVRNALADARQQREIIVRVNPQDVEALQKNKPRLLEVLARAQSIDIREDASVTRGGCIVVTELGTIDASFERQMDALQSAIDEELVEALAGRMPSGHHEELDPEDDPGAGGFR